MQFVLLPLNLDTPVEDHFSHGQSVKLHLDLITLSTGEGEVWAKSMTDKVWKELARAIPEVKPIILSWFIDNLNIFSKGADCSLADKLRSCDQDVKKMPKYAKAIAVFRD